jgi:hypothetical protein
MFENRVLRRIFKPERKEVTRQMGTLCNQKLYNSYTASNITRLIKSRRMR